MKLFYAIKFRLKVLYFYGDVDDGDTWNIKNNTYIGEHCYVSPKNNIEFILIILVLM